MKKTKLLCLLLAVLFIASVAISCQQAPPAPPPENDNDNDDDGDAVPDVYPSRMIEMVVPFGPGGGTDIFARFFAAVAPDYLDGYGFHVVNRPGASAAVGTTYLKNAAPDGYTIGLASRTPIMTSVLEDTEYKFPDDFIGVCVYRASMTALIANNNAPYQTWEEFVDAVKANPGQIVVGGTLGSTSAFYPIYQEAGMEINYVPYDSQGDAMTDLLGGHIQYVHASTGGTIELVATDSVKALVHTGWYHPEQEYEDKNVPMITDFGFEPSNLSSWIIVPKGTPEDKVKYLSNAFEGILSDPVFIKLITDAGEGYDFVPYPEAHEWLIRESQVVQDVVDFYF